MWRVASRTAGAEVSKSELVSLEDDRRCREAAAAVAVAVATATARTAAPARFSDELMWWRGTDGSSKPGLVLELELIGWGALMVMVDGGVADEEKIEGNGLFRARKWVGL